MDKLFLKTAKLSAQGIYLGGKLKILKGSKAKKDLSSSYPQSLINQREELIAKGVLIEVDDSFVFTEDYLCKSPSEASNLIMGASSNGLLNWKDSFGKPLKSLLRNFE